MSDAQKSEVHSITGDAATSPTAAGDRTTTRPAGAAGTTASPKRDLEPLKGDVRVVRDDTDSGGPLVIKSDDPALQKLDLPKDPFPTERTPEVDVPVDKR